MCNIGKHLIRHTHAKILVGALGRQVSQGDTNDEIVDYYCNLAYALKLGKT